jgi:hypothetical protein
LIKTTNVVMVMISAMRPSEPMPNQAVGRGDEWLHHVTEEGGGVERDTEQRADDHGDGEADQGLVQGGAE